MKTTGRYLEGLSYGTKVPSIAMRQSMRAQDVEYERRVVTRLARLLDVPATEVDALSWTEIVELGREAGLYWLR